MKTGPKCIMRHDDPLPSDGYSSSVFCTTIGISNYVGDDVDEVLVSVAQT